MGTTRINRTDGTEVANIKDGDANTDYSLTLVGRLYRNYGELINENFVKLLENFANSRSPDGTILTGQLWYDTSRQALNVYRSTGFISLAILTTSAAAPNEPSPGDLWYDTFSQQLKMQTGSGWLAVSPSYTSAQGKSGVFVETIRDNLNNNHVCVLTYQSGNVLSLHCIDTPEWYPQSAVSGLVSIKPGLNLSSFHSQKFIGTASDSDSLGGLAASTYVRNDVDGSIDGSLTLANAGLIIDDFQIAVENSQTNISRSDGSMNFIVNAETILSLNDAGQVQVANGTESRPGISFVSENNSGIYKVNNNVIGVSIAGAGKLEISADGLYINGNIQVDNAFVGTLNAGDITASNITTTDVTILGTSTLTDLQVNGDLVVGNAANDTITFNANTLSLTNDLLIDQGTVTINQDLYVNGVLLGAGGTSALSIAPGLFSSGTIETESDLIVGGTIDIGGLLSTDPYGRVTINSTVPAAYANVGDVALGRTNGIRSYNSPKMWIAYNGTLTGLTVYDSFNINAVTRTSANNYSFTTEYPITSSAMAVVGSNGTQLVANPGFGSTSFSITTTSENAHMALVVLSQ